MAVDDIILFLLMASACGCWWQLFVAVDGSCLLLLMAAVCCC